MADQPLDSGKSSSPQRDGFSHGLLIGLAVAQIALIFVVILLLTRPPSSGVCCVPPAAGGGQDTQPSNPRPPFPIGAPRPQIVGSVMEQTGCMTPPSDATPPQVKLWQDDGDGVFEPNFASSGMTKDTWVDEDTMQADGSYQFASVDGQPNGEEFYVSVVRTGGTNPPQKGPFEPSGTPHEVEEFCVAAPSP